MITFAEHLIAESVITQDQLLAGINEQTRRLRPVAEIALQSEVLSTDQVVQILLDQGKNKRSFFQSFRNFPFWDESLEQKIEAITSREATPLSQILVEKGYLDHVTLLGAFDRYQQKPRIEPEPKVEVEPVVHLAPPPIADTEVSFNRDLSPDIFPEGFYDNLKTTASEYLKPDLHEVEFQVATELLFHGFYQIRGSAQFLDATEFQDLAEIFSDHLQKMIQSNSFPSESQRSRLSGLLQSALTLVERNFNGTTASNIKINEIRTLCGSLQTEFTNPAYFENRKVAS